MKFESEFGIDEIVISEEYRNGERIASELWKVVYIVFDRDSVIYQCRHSTTGNVVGFKEYELIGDPDYDQEFGTYLPGGKDEYTGTKEDGN